MRLEEKLQTIYRPHLPVMGNGSAETIKELWDNFIAKDYPNDEIKSLLPTKETMHGWYEILTRYVEEDGAIFAIRNFNNWASGSNKDDKTLRRGFLNETDDNYSFFYTDNFFAAYFEKMAIDNYVPEYEEFKSAMMNRKFPARYGHYTHDEDEKAAYPIHGELAKNPQFVVKNKKYYKISHIIDAGENFYDSERNETLTITDICDRYCNRGDYSDWKNDNGEYYSRHLTMNSEAKKYIVAHFLRFACPLNYILTPSPGHQTLEKKVKRNDIGEMYELHYYVIGKFKERYEDLYEEYLSKLMLPPNYFDSMGECDNYENIHIGLRYYSNSIVDDDEEESNQVESTSYVKSKKKVNTKVGKISQDEDFEQLFKEYLESHNVRSSNSQKSYISGIRKIKENERFSSYDEMKRHVNEIISKYEKDGEFYESIGSKSRRAYINGLKKLQEMVNEE